MRDCPETPVGPSESGGTGPAPAATHHPVHPVILSKPPVGPPESGETGPPPAANHHPKHPVIRSKTPGGPGLAPVALLSASALAYQLVLMRLMAVSWWGHFAAAVLALALLGYGASGTVLALAEGRLGGRAGRFFPWAAALFGLLAPAAAGLALRVPFNPLAAPWEPGQWGLLGALYLLLALPLVAVGAALGLAYRARGPDVPSLYRADLLGAAAGVVAALAPLGWLPPGTGLRVVALGGFLAAAAALPFSRGAAVAALGLVLAAGWPGPWLVPRPSPYKALSLALAAPGARVLAESWSPLGHLAAVASPEVPLRHAPGLSLTCPGEVPPQVGVYRDGSFLGALDPPGADLGYLGCLPSAAPYRLREAPRVLVLGAGTGAEVRGALLHGASSVVAVEGDGRVGRLGTGAYGPPGDPRVAVHAGEPRAFVAASRDRFDLIQVALPDSFAGALAGAQGAAEGFGFTAEALGRYLGRLAPGGLLALTQWLQVPPRQDLKLFATAAAALEARGVRAPGDHLALVRSWNVATLLVAEAPLSAADLAALRAFGEEHGFDFPWLPGAPLADDLLAQGCRELLGPGRGAFLSIYPFAVAPATDDRPYVAHTFRWRTLPELLAARGRGGGALVDWAYLLLPATALFAALAGAGLILAPLGRLHRGPRPGVGGARVGAYFIALGLGFFLIEITTLQRLALLLGHPLFAAAATLTVFLACAGLGAAAGGRWIARHPRGATWAPVAVAGLAVALEAVTPAVTAWLGGLPLAARAAGALALLAPLAFAMGAPFALGLRALARQAPPWIPWAWGLNATASVWAAAGAPLVSLHGGFSATVGLAVALYLAAALAARGWLASGQAP